ncbi:hypothetical protein P280DRAFT_547891 [Massarina eburnea CBS 473.64]|uniref:CCZ1/INTU/HSP4 first Longin domain-containing protein n=1 Tax=Massarina eburnea CBS 473.64 TaxID=1395130 RepID=A0A6A6S474_9PLEO|nr:hypothetical protein P280DRAFT_547891 [Massarina eburnea CBS 473.64]
MSSTTIPKVVPAQLSFLALYNPSLGSSDATFHNQIVFYYSKAAKARSRIAGKDARAEKELREQENEKLRQVGLAQGMVGFARSFSNGAAVDSVETEKSRIVLHELETGWWILASVDLTQLPAHSSTTAAADEAAIEYSSREVSPPKLLLQQLVRAHSIFLLHHGNGLGHLYQKFSRDRFMDVLDRYWSRFASTWDVLLHASPAVDIYNGMKLAAGGELGMGVGEEEWGSGERLVLEDYVHNTDGLVDLMVSRFGEPSPLQERDKSEGPREADTASLNPWVGCGRSPSSSDGTVFSGVGAVSRKSLRDLSHWVESIYCYGDHAYGVRDNPTADRRRRRRHKRTQSSIRSVESAKPAGPTAPQREESSMNGTSTPRIPPPVVKSIETSLNKASAAVDASNSDQPQPPAPSASLGDTDTWMKYLTLGYGTAWGGGKKADDQGSTNDSSSSVKETPAAPMRQVEPTPDIDHVAEKLKSQIHLENSGYFAIGLKGDLGGSNVDDENEDGDWNNRTVLRTVYVELTPQPEPTTPGPYDNEADPMEKEFSLDFSFTSSTASRGRLSRLRPVVYIHRPFIYTFLFKHRTEALIIANFYRNLHTYFSPLHRALSNSTSPNKIAARLSQAFDPYTTTSSSSNDDTETNPQPIYDLAFDPRTLTVHSSLPNIPEPGTLIAEGLSSNAASIPAGWSRVEALNVHSQIIATVTSTRRNLAEIERTCKTSRGWWVVWMRLPPSQIDSQESNEPQDHDVEMEDFDTDQLREAFLVRRARDAHRHKAQSSGSRFGSAMWGGGSSKKTGGAAAGWGPKGLAEGIGIDARRYVEGLLSLNR